MVVLVAKLVISGILSSIFFILALYTSFLTTAFLLHPLVYLNQQDQVLIYEHLIYLLYFSNCLNYLEYLFSLSISNLSTLDFKLANSTPVAFLKSAFVA